MTSRDPARLRKAAGARRKRPAAPPGGEDRYKALVEQLPVGVYRTTPEGRFIEANSALARMLGFKKPQALFSCKVEDFYVHGRDRADHIALLSAKPTAFREFELRRADGRKFWARDHSRRIKGPGGAIEYFDGILVDITERKTAERRLELTLRKLQLTNEKLEGLSLTDHLTGLNNRRGFMILANSLLKFARRAKHPLSLLYIDMDSLKEINDTFGHTQGDTALTHFANILTKTFRESDVIARLGGDEFTILTIDASENSINSIKARLQSNVDAYN